MKLTDAQLAQFHGEGYLFLPDWFAPDEVRLMKAEVPGDLRPAPPRERAGEDRRRGADGLRRAHL